MTDADLLVAFLQTQVAPDPLGSPEQLQDWLAANQLWTGGPPPAPSDVARVRHLRAAMISLLRNGVDADARTRQTIEEASHNAPLAVALEDGRGFRLVPAGRGVDRAMAELVATLYRIDLRGELKRIKACKRCGFAFYDTSKNRSRIWCDMATCGSQEKARAYRRRHSGRAT